MNHTRRLSIKMTSVLSHKCPQILSQSPAFLLSSEQPIQALQPPADIRISAQGPSDSRIEEVWGQPGPGCRTAPLSWSTASCPHPSPPAPPTAPEAPLRMLPCFCSSFPQVTEPVGFSQFCWKAKALQEEVVRTNE